MVHRGAIGPGRALSRAEVREVDRRAIEELGIPGPVLMENAGLGLCDAVLRELSRRGAPAGAVVGIVCGKGNNGGDGLVLARHLDLRGYSPKVAYCGDLAAASRMSDAGINLRIVERAGLSLTAARDAAALELLLKEWGDAVLLVDALYGTGLESSLRSAGKAVVELLDQHPLPKIAVDLPSGLDCDRGIPLGAAVHAVRTVTFVERKRGFDAPGAGAYTGEVEVVSIGCPPVAWDHLL